MTEPALLLDYMPHILTLGFGMFVLGMVIGFIAGFWRGRVRTSGDDNGWRRLCETINDQQATIEKLRYEVKNCISID